MEGQVRSVPQKKDLSSRDHRPKIEGLDDKVSSIVVLFLNDLILTLPPLLLKVQGARRQEIGQAFVHCADKNGCRRVQSEVQVSGGPPKCVS